MLPWPLLLAWLLQPVSAAVIAGREAALGSKSGTLAIGPVVAIAFAGFLVLLFVAGCRVRRVQRTARVIREVNPRRQPAMKEVTVEPTGNATRTVLASGPGAALLPVVGTYTPAPERRRNRRPSLRLYMPQPLFRQPSFGRKQPLKRKEHLKRKQVLVDPDPPLEKIEEMDEWVPDPLPWSRQRIPSALRPGHWHPGTPTQVANPTIPHVDLSPTNDVLNDNDDLPGGLSRHPSTQPLAPAITRTRPASGPLQLHRPPPTPTPPKDDDGLQPGARDDAASSIISLPLPPYTPSPSPPTSPSRAQTSPSPLSPVTATTTSNPNPPGLFFPFNINSPSPPHPQRHSTSTIETPPPTFASAPSPILRGPRAPIRTSLLPKRMPVPPVEIVISPPSELDVELSMRALQQMDSISLSISDLESRTGSASERSFISSVSKAMAGSGGGSGSGSGSGSGAASEGAEAEGEGSTVSSAAPSSLDVNVFTGKGW